MRILFDGMACIWLQAWRAIGDADILWVLSFAYQVLSLNEKFVLNSTIFSNTTIHFYQNRHTHYSVELLRNQYGHLAVYSLSLLRNEEAVSNQYQLSVAAGWKGTVEVECSRSLCASFLSFREERMLS